jgi:hypothetical protein
VILAVVNYDIISSLSPPLLSSLNGDKALVLLSYTTPNFIDWSFSTDKLGQYINIFLTLTERFYIYNINWIIFLIVPELNLLIFIMLVAAFYLSVSP